jgi:hypothetical protein
VIGYPNSFSDTGGRRTKPWFRRLTAKPDVSESRFVHVEEAERQLADFAQQWDKRYPSISALWRRNWLGVIPLFQFPPEIRKIIYTPTP